MESNPENKETKTMKTHRISTTEMMDNSNAVNTVSIAEQTRRAASLPVNHDTENQKTNHMKTVSLPSAANGLDIARGQNLNGAAPAGAHLTNSLMLKKVKQTLMFLTLFLAMLAGSALQGQGQTVILHQPDPYR